MPKDASRPSPSIPSYGSAPEPINPFNIVPVYANNIGLSGTFVDVQIIFTEIHQGTSGGGAMGPENVVKAMVQMPLAQLGDFIRALQEYQAYSMRNLKTMQDARAKKNSEKS